MPDIIPDFIYTDIMPDIMPDFIYTNIIPNIIPDIVSDIVSDIGPDVLQDGWIPPLEKETAGVISGSEAILKAYATHGPPRPPD
jgi:hypothetical protein